jgi:hypothetical protein
MAYELIDLIKSRKSNWKKFVNNLFRVFEIV